MVVGRGTDNTLRPSPICFDPGSMVITGRGYKKRRKTGEVVGCREGDMRTGTPALGKVHSGLPKMNHFCWGNWLDTLCRMSTCTLGC